MSVNNIEQDGIVYARHIPADTAWNDGLNFFSENNEFVQVGTWQYPAGKELLAHAHNEVKREVPWTQEVLYIRKGSILAKIYNNQDELIQEITAVAGDIMILLTGGHGYQILEDGTQVLEVKNGPYVGAEQDRRRL